MTEKIIKSDAEWRALLTPMQYNVTRRRGTERADSGAYHDHKEKGRYLCICCGVALSPPSPGAWWQDMTSFG